MVNCCKLSPPGLNSLSPSLRVTFAEMNKPSIGKYFSSSENTFNSMPAIDESPALS